MTANANAIVPIKSVHARTMLATTHRGAHANQLLRCTNGKLAFSPMDSCCAGEQRGHSRELERARKRVGGRNQAADEGDRGSSGEGIGMRYSRSEQHPTHVSRRVERRTSTPKDDAPRRRRHARRPKLPVRETLAILRVIATRRATITDLTQAARMSRASVYRLLTGCKRDLGMRIDCEARVFKLRDWGLLDRRKVLK